MKLQFKLKEETEVQISELWLIFMHATSEKCTKEDSS